MKAFVILEWISMPGLNKEKSLYTPINGIALVELDAKAGSLKPLKIHEINFTDRIYSHRKEVEVAAKAVDKTFLSGDQQQKLIKLSQELCSLGVAQAEPTESLGTEYFLAIRFVPVGKQIPLSGEMYFNRRLERKGKVRDIFEQMMMLEKISSELR